ncbi:MULTISPECIES: Lrp/AsnC family transcriptional regulator [Sphingobacterium]|uniref:Lrp/AsnC family transcriptional regulator n=1 Tax=Sphingobacterium TaxID=28453 RepID=UPI001052FC69|nr:MULTISPECIES: Lrp/AsnC family transcriptional regulator [Sphingobacterium]MCW2263093.1 DNA-binding Lrp family transcriptional regulator [Sphingobacterium kitahiroshimense]TCR11923.1 AsnC family transcriptional regulator [Sphingobacterium sp. JUb78]
MMLDETDTKLLKILQHDATLSNKELAFRLHKSIAAIHERVKKLKQQGYIKKVVAILDRQKVNMGLISFSQVFLKAHTAEVLNEFEQEVIKFPEVMECYQMAGSYDFMLRIATKDMQAYHEFLRYRLAVLPHVNTVQTYFVLSETKSETAYPI